MGINITSLTKIVKNAPQINSSAAALHSISGPLMNVSGAAKLFLPQAIAQLLSFSGLGGLSSTLSSIESTFNSVTSFGGLSSQMTSISSTFSSLQGLASGFSSITSLATGLSAFQSLTSGLNTLTGGTTNTGGGSSGGSAGSLGALNTTFGTAAGGIGQMESLAYPLTNLSSMATFASQSTALTQLASWSTSNQPIASFNLNLQNMSSNANLIAMLANLGIQWSQPASSVSVSTLVNLMSDINTLLGALIGGGDVIQGVENAASIEVLMANSVSSIGVLLAAFAGYP